MKLILISPPLHLDWIMEDGVVALRARQPPPRAPLIPPPAQCPLHPVPVQDPLLDAAYALEGDFDQGDDIGDNNDPLHPPAPKGVPEGAQEDDMNPPFLNHPPWTCSG